MAQSQFIQGSWEELSARSEEFKNRQDLILIVPGNADPGDRSEKEGMSLAEALKGRTELVSFDPSDLSEDTGKKLAELLSGKYQKEQ